MLPSRWIESKLVIKALHETDFKITVQEAAVRCSLSLEDAAKVTRYGMKYLRECLM